MEGSFHYCCKVHFHFILASYPLDILFLQSGRTPPPNRMHLLFRLAFVIRQEPPYPPYKQRLQCSRTAAFVMHEKYIRRKAFEQTELEEFMRRIVLIILVSGAILSIGSVSLRNEEKGTKAKLVSVQRADVYQVTAITGRLRYTEEAYLTAPAPGIVSRVCVENGQRLSEGELLMCLESGMRDQVLSSVYGSVETLAITSSVDAYIPWKEADMVMRNKEDCTVRQILVHKGDQVTAGTPVMRVTSNQQEIICSVPLVDANKLSTGMWAWIASDGNEYGTAVITDMSDIELNEDTGIGYRCITLKPEGYMDMPEGLAVDIKVYLAGSNDVLSLPREAITDRETVWWVSEGRCTEIPAQIVLYDEIRAWVDLPEGLTVAIGEFQEGQRISEAET